MKLVRLAIARLGRWLVWDRRNFIIGAAVVYGALVALIAWSMISPYLTDRPTAAEAGTARPSPSASRPEPTWMPTLTPTATPTSAAPDRNPVGGDEQVATEAATTFVVTWLDAQVIPRAAWVKAASALTKGEATKLIQATVPQMVPSALVVRGDLVTITPFSATVNVTITNGEVLAITLDPTDKWKVTMFEPEGAE
jgi:hypothetical protein